MHRFERVGFFGALAVALSLSALSLPGVSSARPPFEFGDSHGDPGAFIEENAEALGLDEATLGAIRTIVEESKDTGEQLHAKLRELHKGMKMLLSQDSPDEASVMKQVDAIGEAETAMQRHRLATMLKIRALLTPEQREAMVQMREESRSHWKRALLEDCEADLAALCPEADDRSSRKQCLKENREKVSAACSDAMKAARRAHHGFHEGCGAHHKPGCSEHGGPECADKEESSETY